MVVQRMAKYTHKSHEEVNTIEKWFHRIAKVKDSSCITIKIFKSLNKVQPTHSHKSSIMEDLNLDSSKASEMHEPCHSCDSNTSIVHVHNCLVEL